MDEQVPTKSSDPTSCPPAATKARIPIRKSHVRRAMRAADGVYAASRPGSGQAAEEGFVLMTAVLLVERLANASGCEPDVVLGKLADCFELKRLHAQALEQGICT
jgi:hypothetical protein